MSILSDIPFVGKLIDDYGEKLVVKGIEKITGVDLSKSELTNEDKQKIMDSQIEIMKLDFEKIKLEKETVLEDKRLDNQDTANSRDTNTKIQESQNASRLAKNTPYILDFIIIISTIVLGLMLFFVIIPESNMNIANIMFGAMLSYSSTILGWHRGSSKGSVDKQKIINEMNEVAK